MQQDIAQLQCLCPDGLDIRSSVCVVSCSVALKCHMHMLKCKENHNEAETANAKVSCHFTHRFPSVIASGLKWLVSTLTSCSRDAMSCRIRNLLEDVRGPVNILGCTWISQEQSHGYKTSIEQ